MSDPQNHFELYFEELRDRWTASDQISHIVNQRAGCVSYANVKAYLQASRASIRKPTNSLAEHSRKLDALERTL
ncbi:MAG: hypothetical protein ABJL57_13200 [Hyphomonas sp.]|jgi:ferritin-like metal-binding protein YciE|uniref:hypothetical protein n=1 Tax=Hyphomonas sp. TaxID=87 RepID=UPI0032662972